MDDTTPARARFTDSLFFALFPDEAATIRIADLAARLRTQHKLKARAIPPDRLHITLHYLGAFDDLPADIVQHARDAASTIALPPVDVTLDRIESFSGRRARRPLVLSGRASASLAALETALGNAAGISLNRHRDFKPHVTLLYDESRIAPDAVEPITWTAHEFALVRSYLGKSRHEVLTRWPLVS